MFSTNWTKDQVFEQLFKLSILVFKNLTFLNDPKTYLRIASVIHLDFENY